MLGNTEGRRRRGRQKMRWLDAIWWLDGIWWLAIRWLVWHQTQWTWDFASPGGSWWWTGKPGKLQSKGLQRVRCDWTELNMNKYLCYYPNYHSLQVSCSLTCFLPVSPPQTFSSREIVKIASEPRACGHGRHSRMNGWLLPRAMWILRPSTLFQDRKNNNNNKTLLYSCTWLLLLLFLSIFYIS